MLACDIPLTETQWRHLLGTAYCIVLVIKNGKKQVACLYTFSKESLSSLRSGYRAVEMAEVGTMAATEIGTMLAAEV